MIVFTTPVDDKIHGLAAAFDKSLGVVVWNPRQVPAYDMFEELKPKYLVTSDPFVNEELLDAISEYKPTWINYGFTNQADLALLPYQRDFSKEHIVIEKKANYALYRGGSFNRFLASDICYISNFDISQRPYVHNFLCSELNTMPYSTKIVGTRKINSMYFIGYCDENECMSTMKSSKICIDFDADILLDCAANKVFCLTNTGYLFPSLNQDNIDKYINSKERDTILRKAYNYAMENTYFHTVAQIGQVINRDWGSQALKTLTKLRTN